MSDKPLFNAALDPGFFEGRLLIDILTWDWKLRIAADSEGGLDYGRDFHIDGRIRAPSDCRGKLVRISLSPFGPEIRFGRGGLKEVGRVKVEERGNLDADFTATLMLPESAIPATATSLTSIWKHLHVWTFDETSESARISAFAFSAKIHQNLSDWADAD